MGVKKSGATSAGRRTLRRFVVVERFTTLNLPSYLQYNPQRAQELIEITNRQS